MIPETNMIHFIFEKIIFIKYLELTRAYDINYARKFFQF
ncbi:hypothetical protein LEP1GSC202_2835 [Leptospira yanagawae serovar Saopaulo str. Sao Paulo = ATCC 700523]|uniref:Uncharacterized protein n=1 Tax=Leptospira yanagawae serovar Saopaulo str. Sao Paulo = ATCC 700523 TaxID=1249483 RepID=A0A5E8HAY5_9LEPT|nr:hypothetical protein LEP1GSC202_2835 [Leptospira yanagawae serovar Saopaulo str. Sao Paulo = ATCC 700523]